MIPPNDHAAKLTELLGLVDERFQAALHAGIARLATSQVTPSPHQRAEAIMATSPRPNCENEEWWVNQITTAIQEASNDTLERGRKRTAEVQAALQAALEDLARVKLAYSVSLNEISRVAAERDEAERLRNNYQKSLWESDAQISECRESATKIADELAKVKQERDGIAAKLFNCEDCGGTGYIASFSADGWPEGTPCDHVAILAAHDRAVAARVLREIACGYSKDGTWPWPTTHLTVHKELMLFAAQYERGEREVPNA